jgi:hypothetical protein
MKYRFFFGLLLVSMALAGAAAQAKALHPAAQASGQSAAALIEVYPTGSYPGDLQNVQAALDKVDSPGTVVMKSTDQSGKPLAFNFGGTPGKTGTGGVIKLLRSDITLTGDGWDETLNEPKTKITGGGGPFTFSPTVSGGAMVFAVRAPGATVRYLKLTSTSAATAVYIASANQLASDHPVVVEGNDLSVVNYCALAYYSGAFPVKINRNVFKGAAPVMGQWLGFTLRAIDSPPYDEPVPPRDALGKIVRFPFEITNNKIIKTPGSTTWNTIYVFGWRNYYSQNPDPEVGCRRTGSSGAYVYQYVQGDNGPVLISGNDIRINSPSGQTWAMDVGTEEDGINHSVVKGNTISGVCAWTLELGLYGHDNVIEGNDFSGTQAYTHISIGAADTTVSNNVLGSLRPLPTSLAMPPGIPQPALVLVSAHYYPQDTPVPNPVQNCVITKNDYRPTGCTKGAILVASENELQWTKRYYASGNEVMNNEIFEGGAFPPGTGEAPQVTVLNNMTNPATSLPYVHDNKIVENASPAQGGPSADWSILKTSRTVLPVSSGDIAHYRFDVRVGPGKYDVIQVHRVVREGQPNRPIQAADAVFLVPGAPQDFTSIFIPASIASVQKWDQSFAVFLAKNDVDVWGVTYGWALVPPDTTDFGFMRGWGVEKDSQHTDIALSIARATRGGKGPDFGPLHLLGFSYGAYIAYSVVGEETQRPNYLRNVKGIIPVDSSLKYPPGSKLQKACCQWATDDQATLNRGEYQVDASFFALLGQLAQTQPDAPSPVPDFAGLTNYQAVLALGMFNGFVGGVSDDGVPKDLLYTDAKLWVDLLVTAPPYLPSQIYFDIDAAGCGSDEFKVSFDDHLREIAVPILYVGSGGGEGEAGYFTADQTASTDVMKFTVSRSDVPYADFAHGDLFLAKNADKWLWNPILLWLQAHRR